MLTEDDESLIVLFLCVLLYFLTVAEFEMKLREDQVWTKRNHFCDPNKSRLRKQITQHIFQIGGGGVWPTMAIKKLCPCF